MGWSQTINYQFNNKQIKNRNYGRFNIVHYGYRFGSRGTGSWGCGYDVH